MPGRPTVHCLVDALAFGVVVGRASDTELSLTWSGQRGASMVAARLVADELALRGRELGDMVAWLGEHGHDVMRGELPLACHVCGLFRRAASVPSRPGWTCSCGGGP